MIGAIVLAAGESRRMGRQKMLLPYGDKTVVEHVVDTLAGGPIAGLIVVTGKDHDRIREAVGYRAVQLIHNPDWETGMLSSVRAGIAAAPPDWEGLLIAIGDQPAIQRDVVKRVVNRFDRGGKGIVVPVYGGRRGHPLVFASAYRRDVLTRHEDRGLRGLLRDYPDDIAEVTVDTDTVLTDMDHPEDYQRELRSLEARTREEGR